MVSKPEKQKALDFMTKLLEQSEGYTILRAKEQELLVQEKHEDKPKTITLVLANTLPDIRSFNVFQERNCQQDTYIVPVFYKDGTTSFVRMVDRNRSWRKDKSLKNYTAQEINQMLHLRGIEKTVMEHFGSTTAYYQPETAHLGESLRLFTLGAADLDYSHIDETHQAHKFAHNRESIDYKLPKETATIQDAAIITFAEKQPDCYHRAWLAGLKV